MEKDTRKISTVEGYITLNQPPNYSGTLHLKFLPSPGLFDPRESREHKISLGMTQATYKEIKQTMEEQGLSRLAISSNLEIDLQKTHSLAVTDAKYMPRANK